MSICGMVSQYRCGNQKNGKIRICIDFKDLNLATPKDEYVMPIADMLIDSAAGHRILSLMDGYAGYNQISLAEEDIPKTAFRCPGALGINEWIVMPFGLKNAWATYQRAMNTIFHDLIGRSMEVYIDDVIIKFTDFDSHLVDLKNAFIRMKQYNLKMNPTKCAFGVSAGNFLGFLVHEKGIEIDANKAKAVLTMRSPQLVKQVQSFLEKVNYLRRFISNAAGKLKPITKLLRNKATDFSWGRDQQKALEEIKEALVNPPVLVPPRGDRPLRLYLANSFDVVSSLLVQEWEDGKERAIYYLSKTLAGPELNYSMPEKMCYSLVFACTRLEHYILPRETEVVSKMDLVRLMLHRPTMQGRLMKWAIKLAPFALRHRPLKAVKWQVVADFLVEFTSDGSSENKIMPYIGTSPWKIFFDGSRLKGKSGARVILEGPGGGKINLQLQMEDMTHNSAEYEALILGLEALIAKGVQSVLIYGNSQLVINQVLKRYACNFPHLHRYRDVVLHLLYRIGKVVFQHVPRVENQLADNLAQSACQQLIGSLDSGTDWRTEIMVHLESPNSTTHVRVRLKALRFQLIDGVLYKRTFEGVLLRCLGPEESIKIMEEICQRMSRVPEAWSFTSFANSGFADNGKTLAIQSLGVGFPLKNAAQKEVIEFVLNHIIYRFGIPHTLTTDQGLMFTGEKFVEFLAEYNVKLHHSSPYYPQANGLAEAANKIIIGIIRKMVEENPRKWHTLLYQALWAHRNSRSTSTGFSPYQLTFGQDAVLHAEFVVPAPRVPSTTTYIDEVYLQKMWRQLEELDTDRLNALDQVIRQSEIRAKCYGKRVVPKFFAEGDLVWKTILPTYKKVDQLGKWSPNWEGPFIIHEIIGNGAFIIINQEGKTVHENINAKYLKRYYPTFSELCH
ncbi:uncharacterized protein LOC127258782 [Andrographis paniculata]|uniref:uncharacterized protein LOC127258782 n=1 Tax=Andrographis paniculata TaxID=175694 RepID=UPI0021E95910|nr:uncharacterized protein LOC127258782 [Andrographis paniculata]